MVVKETSSGLSLQAGLRAIAPGLPNAGVRKALGDCHWDGARLDFTAERAITWLRDL